MIRHARPDDAAALLRLYAPFVERTAVSFETEVPTVEAFASRMTPALPWLVHEAGGFAYASPHRARAAYRWSVETSVYVDEGSRRRGVARALYARLLGLLRLQGYASAYAGIVLPNEASVAFHASMGFERIGVFPGVGYKFGRWHDVEWWSRALRRGDPPPPRPTPEALLVDLDDTIVDSSGGAEASWREACADPALGEAVLRVREWFWSDPARHTRGRRDLRSACEEIVRRAVERTGADASPERVAARYRELRIAALRPIPGAIEAIDRLRGLGLRLALVTNGATVDQRAKIARFDLARRFDHIQIEEEFGAGKPEPRVYEAALAALGVRAERAWFVGDHPEWDVAAPMRLGMEAVQVTAERPLAELV